MPAFRTILVAADFSERSREAFGVACALAEETKTRIVLLHVLESTPVMEQAVAFNEKGIPVPLSPAGAPHRQAIIERLGELYVPTRPIDVEIKVRDGIAVDEIIREAHDLGPDVIVLGTHGRTGLSRVLAGSVAEGVLRRADCPVLALHSGASGPTRARAVKVILHPTDFSPSAETALQFARSLARDHGAHLLLLHVEPIEMISGVALAPRTDPRTYYEPLMEMRGKIEGPDLKFPVEIQCERGDPATAILSVADDIRCDLIVLGTHGRTALGRLLMGSVAQEVLRRAGCPTLIIKARRNAHVQANAETAPKAVTVL
jgi:nucleotide-binding universal stress UspA family protein